jgi:NDP-sugar pyrophosphorylase family protein
MKSMILAAGFGTRFRPVTYTLPKPMVPLLNRPLIAWAVESLLTAGVNEIIVNLHHLPEALERFLIAEYSARVKFHFSFEEEILGTGGGVRRVRPQLENEQDFFLVNGDTIQFPPWDELRDARRSRDSIAAITLRHPPAHDKFTAVYFDDRLVTGFGKGIGEPLMFSGSHVISSRIFRYLPEKEFSGIVDEVYQPLIDAKTETLAGFVDDGLWFDIGTPQRYLSAMIGLLAADVSKPPAIASSAKIRGTINRSTVGARSTVDGDLRDSAVWDDCTIGANVQLERCIVAHGVTLNGPVELKDALICRDDAAIPDDAKYERRDGVVIARL